MSQFLSNHAEAMVVPHELHRPLRQHIENQQELLAIINPEEIDDYLSGITDLAEREDATLAAADFICLQAREALWYPEVVPGEGRDDYAHFGIKRGEPVPLSELAEKQVADCFGFVITASECLEAAGINHWIGFANGHTTLLLPTEAGQKFHMIDPLTPELSQDLQYSMVTGYPLVEDMRLHGKSAIELNSYSLASRAKGDTDELLRKNPWLVFKKGDSSLLLQDQFGNHDSKHPSRFRILMSSFKPEDGRKILDAYNTYELAYLRGDYSEAAMGLEGMSGTFPDVDARQRHSPVKRILRELCQRGEVDSARQLLKGYFDSFDLMRDDSRVTEAEGDCLRVIAREGQDVEAAQLAVNVYEKVLIQYPNAYKPAVTGKLGKATALRAELQAILPARVA